MISKKKLSSLSFSSYLIWILTALLYEHKIRSCLSVHNFLRYWFKFEITFFWPSVYVFSTHTLQMSLCSLFLLWASYHLEFTELVGHLRVTFNILDIESIKLQRGSWVNKLLGSIGVKPPVAQLWCSHQYWNISKHSDSIYIKL